MFLNYNFLCSLLLYLQGISQELPTDSQVQPKRLFPQGYQSVTLSPCGSPFPANLGFRMCWGLADGTNT